MTDCASIAGVLLAAGRGTRFGGNKLEAMLGKRMLGVHAAHNLAAMKCGWLFAVHDPAHDRLAAALTGKGFTLLDNHAPGAGLSHSLALAARAAMATAADVMLVCLADMPFVTTAHLAALVDAGGDHVVASAIGEVRMPPALFPRAHWAALTNRLGDVGARHLLGNAIMIQGAAEMLADIDTRADLNRSS
jgi:molybdenum cofactor cytidylyltransferase